MDVFSKDIRVVDSELKLGVSIYIYLVLFKSKGSHLSDMELKAYSKLLLRHVSKDLKKGSIREISDDNKSIYTYIDRIKKSGLLRKEGDDFLFPPDILRIAEQVVAGKDVVFSAKVYGNEV